MAPPIQTPCCPTGFLKTVADPTSSVATPYVCGVCGKGYTTLDVLTMVGAPIKTPKPPKSKPMPTVPPDMFAAHDPFKGMRPVHGRTYEVKEELKQLGGRWNAASKVWMVPADRLLEAERIVADYWRQQNTFMGQGPHGHFTSQHHHYVTATHHSYATTQHFTTASPGMPRVQEYRPTPPPVPEAPRRRPGVEYRRCWECGNEFAEGSDGWADYWCGCTDQKKPKAVPPPVEDEDEFNWSPSWRRNPRRRYP